jgi:hypothetical protein
MKRYSIIQNEKKCYVCGLIQNIHIHEVWFGRNRKNSIEDGLVVYLCGRHHNLSNEGVHFNHELDLRLKKIAEQRWLEVNESTIDEFIRRYGRNVL